jgi:hypothetical protein
MSTLDPAVRDLLQAVCDALDVPRKDDLRADNAAAVSAALEAALTAHILDDPLRWAAAWIRKHATDDGPARATQGRSA